MNEEKRRNRSERELQILSGNSLNLTSVLLRKLFPFLGDTYVLEGRELIVGKKKKIWRYEEDSGSARIKEKDFLRTKNLFMLPLKQYMSKFSLLNIHLKHFLNANFKQPFQPFIISCSSFLHLQASIILFRLFAFSFEDFNCFLLLYNISRQIVKQSHLQRI